MYNLKSFSEGYKAYNKGIKYPLDWSKACRFKEGWETAALDDEEEKFDSDADFSSFNYGQDY